MVIIGSLLVYIGYKMSFPSTYMVLAWFTVFLGALKVISGFFKGVYDAGVEDGESKSD